MTRSWPAAGRGRGGGYLKHNGECANDQSGGGKLCLTDPGNSKSNGVQLTVATCKNTANQHWTLP